MDNAQKPTHEDYLKVLEENACLRTENEMLKQTEAKKAKVKVATLTQVTVKKEPSPEFIDIDLLTPPNSSQKRPLESKDIGNMSAQKKPKLELIGVVLHIRKQSEATRESTRFRSSSARRNTDELGGNFHVRVSVSPGPGDTDSEPDLEEKTPIAVSPKMDMDVAQAAAPAQAPPAIDEKHFKAKVKKDMELDAVTIRKRIDKIGCPAINVTLPKDIWSQTVSRQFLSNTYGGSPQEVFPKISTPNVARHKRENWMLFSLLLHPDAPQIPGTPGVWYDSCGFSEEDQSDKVYHAFARIDFGKWRYVGDYQCFAAESLTQTEWLLQENKVRRAWSNILARVPWGRRVRAMIHLRKQLRREPSEREINDALMTENKYLTITAQEIEKAYDQGKQRLGILVLKCVKYDEAFQRELIQKFSVWVPPPPKVKGTPKRSRKGKGKAHVEEADESEEEVREKEEASGEGHDLELQSEVYIRRGTRSRPSTV